MKISKETWKDILKIVGTIIATIASVLACRRCHCRRLKASKGMGEAWKTASPIPYPAKHIE